ncbi:MAG: carboxypeptidase regulatory-like domain-containing protein [Planctomycetales bacterium]|nr:carboxypeptidase regulatory-like domain-containing protein [Planctomycetales bacterium]
MEGVRTYLPHWLWPGDDRSRTEIEDEIEEELRLHMDLLVQANEQSGMDASEAQAAAAKRFGDIDAVRRRCLQIKQGDVPMLSRIQAGLTVLLLGAVIFMGWRQWVSSAATVQFMNQTTAFLTQIRQDMQGLRDDLQRPGEPAQQAEQEPVRMGDVRGYVMNESQQPIAGARVLAVFKSWPGGQYRQEGRTVVTDERGRFRFKDAAPINRQRGIHIAVFAEGYAFESQYKLSEETIEPTDKQSFVFQLEASTPVVLQLKPTRYADSTSETLDNQPLYDTHTFQPSARQTVDGSSHMVYSEGIELVEVASDEEGRVTLPWFAQGDTAEFAVRRGSELVTVPLLVIDQPGRTVLKGQGQDMLTPVIESP